MSESDTLRTIVRIQVGSHLYGTATPLSDRDYKGVFLPSKQMVLLGKVPNCYASSTSPEHAKNAAHDVDEEIYSLHYFLRLACEGQTIALDMLHAPEEMILEFSDIWRAIVKERHRFYTRNLRSFVRYARRQASKYGIKGARLNAVIDVLSLLKQVDASQKLYEIWEQLPQQEFCHEAERAPHGIRQYQVCGKLFHETVAIDYMIPILEKFAAEYGQRAQLAAENTHIDWKAISHALRVAYQVKEILTKQTITFPLSQAKFLIQVKTGELDYLTEVAPTLDLLMDEVETLINSSMLPEAADSAFWETFLCDILERKLFGDLRDSRSS